MECKMTANSNLYQTNHTFKTLGPLFFELWPRKDFLPHKYTRYQLQFKLWKPLYSEIQCKMTGNVDLRITSLTSFLDPKFIIERGHIPGPKSPFLPFMTPKSS